MARPVNPDHKCTYFTTGRPRTHFRSCSCGWITNGKGTAAWARRDWEAHLAEVSADA